MAYPTGTPVAERALANLQTALETIQGSPDYYTTLAASNVIRNRGDNVMQVLKVYPGILILEGEVVKDENSAWPMVECEMPVVLRCALNRRGDGTETDLRRFAADVAHCVRQNYRLADGGGDVALVAYVTGEQVYQSDEAIAVAAVDVVLRIRYRYLYDDPNTPV